MEKKTMNNKWKFVTCREGFVPKEVDTFEEAFKEMYDWVNKQIENHTLSYQVLETAIWIENPEGMPIYFYDARDTAITMGFLGNDQKIKEVETA
jgi:hypothetical protein